MIQQKLRSQAPSRGVRLDIQSDVLTLLLFKTADCERGTTTVSVSNRCPFYVKQEHWQIRCQCRMNENVPVTRTITWNLDTNTALLRGSSLKMALTGNIVLPSQKARVFSDGEKIITNDKQEPACCRPCTAVTNNASLKLRLWQRSLQRTSRLRDKTLTVTTRVHRTDACYEKTSASHPSL